MLPPLTLRSILIVSWIPVSRSAVWTRTLIDAAWHRVRRSVFDSVESKFGLELFSNSLLPKLRMVDGGFVDILVRLRIRTLHLRRYTIIGVVVGVLKHTHYESFVTAT